jgi:hypothetical protein
MVFAWSIQGHLVLVANHVYTDSGVIQWVLHVLFDYALLSLLVPSRNGD